MSEHVPALVALAVIAGGLVLARVLRWGTAAGCGWCDGDVPAGHLCERCGRESDDPSVPLL